MMHKVHWAVPAPTWGAITALANAGERAAAIRRPMLLRFASDDFMQELAGLLDDDPERLSDITARPGETWREYPGALALPPAKATLLATPLRRKLGARFKLTKEGQASDADGNPPAVETPTQLVLKLFQSSHQRYYLVAASVVCRFPGLPDHFVDPAKQERPWFVVRRLVPRSATATEFDPAQSDEHAFVTTDTGSTWVKVETAEGAQPALVRGEEKLPMFGSPYIGRDGVSRRLFTGLVPVSRREAYMAAPQGMPATPSVPNEEIAQEMGAFLDPADTRVVMLVDDVIAPMRALQTQARDVNKVLAEAGKAPNDKREEPARLALLTRNQILHSSWFVLLDFAAYLKRYLPAVRSAIDAGSKTALTTEAERNLFDTLSGVSYTSDNPKVSLTLAQALAGFEQYRPKLDQGPTLLSDATSAQFASLPRFALGTVVWPSVDTDEIRPRKFSEQLKGVGPNAIKAAVEAALKDRPPDRAVPPSPAIAHASIPSNRSTRFVLRCVLDRPHCGAGAEIVSEPTEPFVMAPFFDPDAPARQVRIALPVDTSPAALRKYPKSASFLISDVLCGQVGGARKLTLGDLVLSVLPWPFHKDLPEPNITPCATGMLCSLSIPIVTLCALILLIIIVTLFTIFFGWLPFLISCFPLKLKAKEQV